MRVWLFFPLASLFLLACPDAQPGDPKGGGGGDSSGGNDAGGNNLGAGNVGGAPDFSSATPTLVSAPEDDPGNQYGYTVAVSGDTVAIGAFREWYDLMNAGGVHVYTQSGTSFEPQAVLHAQPSVDDTFFGYAVSISGDVLWTTAPAYSEPAVVAGAAYVLTRGGDTWLSQAMVQEDDPHEYGNFGRSVAVSGTIAVVGAPQTSEGQAFLFEESGGEWLPAGELIPDEDIWDYGAGVAIDGDTIARRRRRPAHGVRLRPRRFQLGATRQARAGQRRRRFRHERLPERRHRGRR
jgi:FG-GAP repeat